MPTTNRPAPIIPLVPSGTPVVVPSAAGATCAARQLPEALPRLSPEDARAMEQLEIKALAYLGIADPYGDHHY